MAQEKTQIVIMVGTSRAGNKSQLAARYLESFISQNDSCRVRVIKPEDFDMPGDGNDDAAADPE